ncbi:MAG: threonine--tRNA ligase [candidate division KSB1 bacterium]|nr:threonine--tRNA ligase [candidate division KSB1 bacterium]MDZ7365710.1 threonine--tRNA ligase [candidate division KSB1 bacterium]MDZ7403810.1 threonine--tRNA ligase [candidate division KSB1 bacterium]
MSELIRIEFPDGKSTEYPKGIRPNDILKELGRSLAEKTLAAKFNDKVVDLDRPLQSDGRIRFVTWDDPEGKEVYWHSTSHIMAHAIKELYPEAQFGVGPPIEDGFYYDIDVNTSITAEELAKIEAKMKEVIAADQPFRREEMSKDEAVRLFEQRSDKYKLELLRDLDDNHPSVYHEGNFVDLCRGPHLPSTGRVKYFKLLSVAGAYWRGSEKNKMLQRIYGISFPKKEMLDEHLRLLEEARRRDHRRLGQELDLFFITPKVGGGLPLWMPKGTIIRETLEKFLREEQRKRGYLPVVTPHIGNLNLYRTSGHYPYYKDSQFAPVKVEDEEYLLKPMNCPHHFQIYAARPRSYRDLPIRLAEFGTVYRYEQSGELNGLTRVRGFTVDDSHMFVRQDQLKEELCGVIDLIQLVFRTLGFGDFTTRLSFRDDNKDKYGGSEELWEQAQKDIKEAADECKLQYVVAPGEAAFYGPKIDFIIRDVLGRSWQLGTVQVDYVMPERFELEYTGRDNQKHRPVVIHRAPFGSLERFIGILIEHYAGAFPTWLAPVQAVILPITDAQIEYAAKVEQVLAAKDIRCMLDDRNEKIGYKIREAETKKIPYMLVVGAKEAENNAVAVRKRRAGDLGSMPLDAFVSQIVEDIQSKRLE